jgi:hypothetical protein
MEVKVCHSRAFLWTDLLLYYVLCDYYTAAADEYTNHILYPLLPALSIHILLPFPFLLLPSLSHYTLIILGKGHVRSRTKYMPQ